MNTTRFKLFFVLCLCTATFCSFAGNKTDFTRKLHMGWIPEDVETMSIFNKYGDVTIKEMTGDSITIDVVITIEDTQEKRAKYLLEQIEVDFSDSGSTAKAVTSFGDSFKTREKFSIDYFVYIPSDRNLDISNKYGHIYLDRTTGNCNFNIRYGGIQGNQILAPELSIESAYSRIDIQEIINLTADVKYSKVYLEKAEDIDIESKYSVLSVEEMNNLNAESRYDTYRLTKLNNLDLEAKYTGTKITTLNGNLQLENGYGAFTAETVTNFESIVIDSQYAGIKLGIDPNIAYKLKAYASYCNIKYPATDRMNKMRENTSLELDGTIGDGTPEATVTIETRYGSVSLLP